MWEIADSWENISFSRRDLLYGFSYFWDAIMLTYFAIREYMSLWPVHWHVQLRPSSFLSLHIAVCSSEVLNRVPPLPALVVPHTKTRIKVYLGMKLQCIHWPILSLLLSGFSAPFFRIDTNESLNSVIFLSFRIIKNALNHKSTSFPKI